MNYVDSHLSKNEKEKVNKRAIYYSLLGEEIKSTNELDSYIAEICFILQLRRKNLQIVRLDELNDRWPLQKG